MLATFNGVFTWYYNYFKSFLIISSISRPDLFNKKAVVFGNLEILLKKWRYLEARNTNDVKLRASLKEDKTILCLFENIACITDVVLK